MGVKMDILSLKDYFRLVKFLNRQNIFSHIILMDKQQFQTLEKPNGKLHSKITTKSRLFFVLFLIRMSTALPNICCDFLAPPTFLLYVPMKYGLQRESIVCMASHDLQ